MAVKNAMTADFLRSAYGGESMAHMRYLIWGDMAAKEGFPNIQKLFHAVSYAERVHAGNHFREIDGETADAPSRPAPFSASGKRWKTCRAPSTASCTRSDQMYPVYLNTAQFQQESGAERSFHYALEAEKIHAALFSRRRLRRTRTDLECHSVYICPICGHTVLDEAPDNCPVCGAKKSCTSVLRL
jgi:rubrerythrin